LSVETAVSVAAVVEAALDSLQNFSFPKAVISNSSFSRSIVFHDAALPSLPRCVMNDHLFSPVAVTAGLSLSPSVGRESNIANSSMFGASLPRIVSSSHILPARNQLVSSPEECKNHCSVVTSTCGQSQSTNKTSSAQNNSKSSRRRCDKVSVDLCHCLPAVTTCRSCGSSEPVVSPAVYASVSKATALKNRLSASSDSGCDSDMLSCHSILAGSSVMQVPRVTMETSGTSVAVTKRLRSVSLGFHPVTSSHGTASYSGPLTLAFECTSTSSGSQPFPVPLPSSKVHLDELRPQTATVASVSCSSPLFVSQCRSITAGSVNQSSLPPTPQHLVRNLRSRSALRSSSGKANASNIMPVFEAVSPLRSSFPNAAATVSVMASSQAYVDAGTTKHVYSCTTSTTGMVNPVHKHSVPLVGLSDQARMCTIPSTRICNRVRISTVSSTSAASDGVRTFAVPVVEFFSNANIHAAPAFRVSSPIQPRVAPTAGICSPVHTVVSMPVCTNTMPAAGISSTVVFDRAPTCTVPAVGISGQIRTSVAPAAARILDRVRLCAIPSVGIYNPVFEHSITTTMMKSNSFESGNTMQNGDPKSSLIVSSRVPNSASVPRTRRVLPPATGCSSRQTPVVLSASMRNSLSVCSPSQVTVKPLELLVSTPSVTHSCSISHTSAVSVCDRHFLDSIMSLKPRPVLSSQPKHGEILPSSLNSSTVAGSHVHRPRFSRNPITASAHIKATSVPLSAVSSIPVFPGVLHPLAGSVDSFAALTSRRGNDTRPTFVLISPQHQPLLEKIALQLATQRPSVAGTRPQTKIRHVTSFVGAADLVAVVASSSEDVCHANRESRRHSRTADDTPESVVKILSSSAGFPRHNNSTIHHQNVRKFSSSTASVAESVVMVTSSSHHYGNTENCRRRSLTSGAPPGKGVEPVVRVTASLAGCCHHGNREMSPVANNTAVSDTKKSPDVTDSAVDNYCISRGKAAVSAANVWRKAKRVKLCSEVKTCVLHTITIYCS